MVTKETLPDVCWGSRVSVVSPEGTPGKAILENRRFSKTHREDTEAPGVLEFIAKGTFRGHTGPAFHRQRIILQKRN